jgi:hypothetical protein
VVSCCLWRSACIANHATRTCPTGPLLRGCVDHVCEPTRCHRNICTAHLRLRCTPVYERQLLCIVPRLHKLQHRALHPCQFVVVAVPLLRQPTGQGAGRRLLCGVAAAHAGAQNVEAPQASQATKAVWEGALQPWVATDKRWQARVGARQLVCARLTAAFWQLLSRVHSGCRCGRTIGLHNHMGELG